MSVFYLTSQFWLRSDLFEIQSHRHLFFKLSSWTVWPLFMKKSHLAITNSEKSGTKVKAVSCSIFIQKHPVTVLGNVRKLFEKRLLKQMSVPWKKNSPLDGSWPNLWKLQKLGQFPQLTKFKRFIPSQARYISNCFPAYTYIYMQAVSTIQVAACQLQRLELSINSG